MNLESIYRTPLPQVGYQTIFKRSTSGLDSVLILEWVPYQG